MNILYIGAGFVGTCSAAVTAASGHQTLVFDIDEKKISDLGSLDTSRIESCLYEKGLADLLIKNKSRIHFTTAYSDVTSFLESCDAIFMCLPTPEIDETGETNLTYYTKAAEQLGESLVLRNNGAQSKYIVIINKSTVPVTMVDQTQELLDSKGVRNVGVVSNPEFLVEGKAIEGSLKPDRIVVGAWNEKDFSVMRSLYQRFYDAPDVQYIEVNPKEAAAGKLLANFYLFNKLAVCFDVIGRTSESFQDVKFEQLRKIIASDARIGDWGFYDSLYAGGSCFIKDARSLSHQLRQAGQAVDIVEGTYLANRRQLAHFLDRSKKEANMNWKDKKVALLGVAFKRDTNDVRNSPSLLIAEFCERENVKELSVYDPEATHMFQSYIGQKSWIRYAADETMAIHDADIVIIATDWPQFRALADHIISSKVHLLMDGRRMLQHEYDRMAEQGVSIISVGSPFISGR